MQTLDTLQDRFSRDLKRLNLTKQQARRHLVRKYALRHSGTREYDRIVKEITDFLEL